MLFSVPLILLLQHGIHSTPDNQTVFLTGTNLLICPPSFPSKWRLFKLTVVMDTCLQMIIFDYLFYQEFYVWRTPFKLNLSCVDTLRRVSHIWHTNRPTLYWLPCCLLRYWHYWTPSSLCSASQLCSVFAFSYLFPFITIFAYSPLIFFVLNTLIRFLPLLTIDNNQRKVWALHS